MTRSVRLDGVFTQLSPLSHIGETIGAFAYLHEEPVFQENGRFVKVFCYSGNAWRGHLRDCAAKYMLDRLERPALNLETFHLLFSGGRISGPQKTDLGQARAMRAMVPMLALWGAGIGTQIMAGALRVGSCYPVCAETQRLLPVHLRSDDAPSYRGMSIEKSFSRRDDAKIDTLAPYLIPPPAPALLLAEEDSDIYGLRAGGTKKRKRQDGEVADQMRVTVELVAAGVRLFSWIEALDVDDVQLGCLVAALHQWSRSPHIGGQASRGHGRVEVTYRMTDLDTGEVVPDFLAAQEGRCLLAPPAADAKGAYDQHLRGLYDAMLADKRSEITALLGAA